MQQSSLRRRTKQMKTDDYSPKDKSVQVNKPLFILLAIIGGLLFIFILYKLLASPSEVTSTRNKYTEEIHDVAQDNNDYNEPILENGNNVENGLNNLNDDIPDIQPNIEADVFISDKRLHFPPKKNFEKQLNNFRKNKMGEMGKKKPAYVRGNSGHGAHQQFMRAPNKQKVGSNLLNPDFRPNIMDNDVWKNDEFDNINFDELREHALMQNERRKSAFTGMFSQNSAANHPGIPEDALRRFKKGDNALLNGLNDDIEHDSDLENVDLAKDRMQGIMRAMGKKTKGHGAFHNSLRSQMKDYRS